MTAAWPALLVNGALLVFLWGLAWRMNNQRMSDIESDLKNVVVKDFCRLQHDEIRQDFIEIKQGQREALASLRSIETRLARVSGRDEGFVTLGGENDA